MFSQRAACSLPAGFRRRSRAGGTAGSEVSRAWALRGPAFVRAKSRSRAGCRSLGRGGLQRTLKKDLFFQRAVCSPPPAKPRGRSGLLRSGGPAASQLSSPGTQSNAPEYRDTRTENQTMGVVEGHAEKAEEMINNNKYSQALQFL